MNSTGAIPSGPINHEDADYAGVKASQRKQRVADRKKQIAELQKRAYPKGQDIIKRFEERIALYESGRNLLEGVQDINTTDAVLGAQLRINLRVTAELRRFVAEVTQARQALADIVPDEPSEEPA